MARRRQTINDLHDASPVSKSHRDDSYLNSTPSHDNEKMLYNTATETKPLLRSDSRGKENKDDKMSSTNSIRNTLRKTYLESQSKVRQTKEAISSATNRINESVRRSQRITPISGGGVRRSSSSSGRTTLSGEEGNVVLSYCNELMIVNVFMLNREI